MQRATASRSWSRCAATPSLRSAMPDRYLAGHGRAFSLLLCRWRGMLGTRQNFPGEKSENHLPAPGPEVLFRKSAMLKIWESCRSGDPEFGAQDNADHRALQ